MQLNYTPLDVDKLGQSHVHDASVGNIALLIIGTLTLGVMLVMLVVIIQNKMVQSKGAEFSIPKSSLNKEKPSNLPTQVEPALDVVSAESSPSESSISGEMISPEVQGVSTLSTTINAEVENVSPNASRIVTTPIRQPTATLIPVSPRE